MNIGLYNLEPNIVNAAMMQVSAYHKKRGDRVELYTPLFRHQYDKIYAFSVFDYTPKDGVNKKMVKGGTGFDVASKLPKAIEAADYDWSLFPKCDYSIVWFSRGCIRKCPFCVVRKKEGSIRSVKPKNLNPRGKFIKVMDNNFFANPKWKQAIKQLQDWGQPVDFQGVDARLLTKEMCEALNSLKHAKQIKVAWDDPRVNLVPKLKKILEFIKPRKLMCYVLIGFWSTKKQDLHRVEALRKLKIDPFVMPYDKTVAYQKDFARWVNNKAIFRTVKWKDYLKTGA